MPNPWGQVPVSDGSDVGLSIERWMARMVSRAAHRDCTSRRHHYVPQAYLRAWSRDARTVRVVDLRRGTDKRLSTKDVCVRQDFYRTTDATGLRHQQVESLLSVVDEETARLVRILLAWNPGDDISFDDWMSLCLVACLQKNRTPQTRRWIVDQNTWMHVRAGQPRHDFRTDDFVDLMCKARHDAADQLSTRQLQLWDDPKGRFFTSDQPLILSPVLDQPPSMDRSPYIWWPLSPTRLAAFHITTVGEKVVHRRASAADVRMVRQAVLRGAEDVLIVSPGDIDLPVGKILNRRPQLQVDCRPVEGVGPECQVRVGLGHGAGLIDNVCRPICTLRDAS